MFAKRARKIKRLLIAEDEPLVAFDTEHFLTEHGFDVVATVDRAEDAVAVLEDQPVDLVLADMRLSGEGGGLEVAYAAKARGVPVLFVTGACPIEAQALAVGCLAKPYPQRALREAIDAVEARLGGDRRARTPPGLTLYDRE